MYFNKVSPLKYSHYRRCDRAAAKDDGRDLPFPLLLARPGINPQHQKQYVQTAANVEYLEQEIVNRALPKEIDIACEEDQGIQRLGQQRDTLGRAPAVDGEYEDNLRGEM